MDICTNNELPAIAYSEALLEFCNYSAHCSEMIKNINQEVRIIREGIFVNKMCNVCSCDIDSSTSIISFSKAVQLVSKRYREFQQKLLL